MRVFQKHLMSGDNNDFTRSSLPSSLARLIGVLLLRLFIGAKVAVLYNRIYGQPSDHRLKSDCIEPATVEGLVPGKS